MKKLNEVIPSMTGSQGSAKKPESARAVKVWTAMAEMFGNTFLNQFGEDPPSVWMAQIERLGDNEVRNGLNNIAAANLAFPPNLSQFIAACKKPKPEKAGYWDAPKQIEDQRPKGRMSFAEWKEQNKD